MEFLIACLLFTIGGVIIGYCLCSVGTWARVHKQESNIRALANDISVLKFMGDTVPAEWIEERLESMLIKDYR